MTRLFCVKNSRKEETHFWLKCNNNNLCYSWAPFSARSSSNCPPSSARVSPSKPTSSAKRIAFASCRLSSIGSSWKWGHFTSFCWIWRNFEYQFRVFQYDALTCPAFVASSHLNPRSPLISLYAIICQNLALFGLPYTPLNMASEDALVIGRCEGRVVKALAANQVL